MKKNLISFATLLFGALLFQGCQKEEETTTVTQSLKHRTYADSLECDYLYYIKPPFDTILVLNSKHYNEWKTLDVELDKALNQYYFEVQKIDYYSYGPVWVPVYFDSNDSAFYDEKTGRDQGWLYEEIHIKAYREDNSIWYRERIHRQDEEYQTDIVMEGYLH